MEPNANQPGSDGQTPGAPQAMPPAPGAPGAPSGSDWQQGLGTPSQTPPAPDGSMPGAGAQPQPTAPAAPGMATPGPQPGQPGMPAAAPVTGGDMSPMNTGGSGKKPSPMMVLIGLVVLLAIVAAVFFLFGGKKSSTANNAAKKSSGSTSAAKAVDLGTLNALKFDPPTDLSAFMPNSTTQAGAYSFDVKGSTSDKACNLSIALFTADQLPGADTNAIVAPQISELRKLGATVDGPNAGTALILKSSDSTTTYSMPTLNYEFTQGAKHASVHYSVVILKNTQRAQISRQCLNANGPTDTAQMAVIDEVATHITVTKQ